MFAPYEWIAVRRGQEVPPRAVVSGTTDTDGEVYVARNSSGEVGKLNLDHGTVWNIWCHHGQNSQEGDILVLKWGVDAVWQRVKSGDPLPHSTVISHAGERDGDVSVARVDGACGKLTVSNGKVGNIWVHGHRYGLGSGEVLTVSCYEWVRLVRGDPLPDGAVYAGTTESDGEVYVARSCEGEPGKLNVKHHKAWNLWCHNGGCTQESDVFVAKGGAPVAWKAVRSGDPLPQGMVCGGDTITDGQVFVARIGEAAGKVNIDSGHIGNFYTHGYRRCFAEGEVLVILPEHFP